MRRWLGAVLVVGASGLLACGGGQKRYVAILSPLNTQVSGNPIGTAEFLVDEKKLTARIDVVGLDEEVEHPQFITTGDTCPGAPADLNGDGFLDAVEGREAFGGALIPLDSDLSSQTAGQQDGFPNLGNYRYEREADLETLVNDLRQADADQGDGVVKLDVEEATADMSPLEALNLNSRTFVIHGVADDLPPTVGTIGSAPAKLLLPIACGNIVDVD